MKISHFREIVDFAIEQEQQAARLYGRLAGTVRSRGTRDTFVEMAKQEREHEIKLKAFAATGKADFPRPGTIEEMHVGDFVVGGEVTENSSIREALVFAMKAERKAYELYSELVSLERDSDARELFEALAAEEMRHKRDLEIEYEKRDVRRG